MGAVIYINTIKALAIAAMFLCFTDANAFGYGGAQTSGALYAAPSQAAAVGYNTRTFHSTFNNDLDLSNTRAKGFNWYMFNSYGRTGTAASLSKNEDGTLRISSTPTDVTYNANIYTMSPTGDANVHVGKAFGGGGYFEASLKVDPVVGDPYRHGAFWANPYGSLVTGNVQWAGQPTGFVHYIETDFLDGFGYIGQGTGKYLANVGEWWGNNTISPCPAQVANNSCIIFEDGGWKYTYSEPNFYKYHKYGWLWVPATDTTQGYCKFFFDGVQVGATIYWDKYTGQLPPPESPWVYSFLDTQKMIVIIGTGLNDPISVESVTVWQKDETGNLYR